MGISILKLHSFLALDSPLDAHVLVVEGWLPDYALEAASLEFQEKKYNIILTVGGSLPRGSHLSEYKNFAELSLATLNVLGIDRDKILALPNSDPHRERTASSASAVSQWLSEQNPSVQSINLLTIGTHSRRSLLAFKKILGQQTKVGVISIHPLNYDVKNWWKSSEGVRTVLSELIAYLYVCFFGVRNP